jgi:dTDP-4-dehydrorhamnose 3,5-epimerase
MLCEKTSIDGAYIITFNKIGDSRGFFSRVFCRDDFLENGIGMEVVQANLSGNLVAGTLRGLHYQAPPFEEDKLVRAVRGAVFDVAVDIREGSPSYGRWHGEVLSVENWKAFFIPKGCAHGYYTIEDNSEIMYFVSSPYTPGAERGIAWDDPVLGVKWPGRPVVVSPKDAAWKAYDWQLKI